MKPLISIIIPTLTEANFIARTLENLKSLALPHEVIVSDGGSTDGTIEIARASGARVVQAPDLGRRQTFGEAKNHGAASATGEFLVFIDADVIVPDPNHFFTVTLEAFRKNPKLVGVTAHLHPYPENHSFTDWFFSEPLNLWYDLWNNLLHLGNASGEFQMIRADTFKKLGGYNGTLIAGEDNEMFARLGKVGRTLSYPGLAVLHSCRRAHKIGWLRLYGIWIRNGLSIFIFHRAAFKEWAILR